MAVAASIFEADHMPCRYDFGYHTHKRDGALHTEQIIEQQKKLLSEGKYLEAVTYFRNSIPLTTPVHCGDDYYKLVATYQLALGLSFLGQHNDAAQHMNRTGTMSAGERENSFFSEHQYFALYLRARQMEAIAAGKPGIIITALPRSASGFLSYAIAHILDVPVMRASMGSFPNHTVVRNWACNLVQGGCVTHEHFAGIVPNISELIQGGVKKVYVQLRDPRAAAWSYLHHVLPEYQVRNETLTVQDIIESVYYPHAIAWIESWVDAQEKFKQEITVEFLFYDEVVKDTKAVLQRLLGSRYFPDIERYMEKVSSGSVKPMHFRNGQAEEWRAAFSKDLKQQAWDRTPKRVRQLLSMEP